MQRAAARRAAELAERLTRFQAGETITQPTSPRQRRRRVGVRRSVPAHYLARQALLNAAAAHRSAADALQAAGHHDLGGTAGARVPLGSISRPQPQKSGPSACPGSRPSNGTVSVSSPEQLVSWLAEDGVEYGPR